MYNFKLASVEYFDDFFRIKSEPSSIFCSGFDSAPNYSTFKEHYKNELSRDDRTIIFLYDDSEIVGYITIDYLEDINSVGTAHGVLSSFSVKGLGKKLINYAVECSKNNLPDAYQIGYQ